MSALKGSFWSTRLLMADADACPWQIMEWLNDPRVVRYSEQRHFHHTRETQEAYLSGIKHDQNRAYWYINLFSQQKPHYRTIGSMSVTIDPNNSIANLGIMLGPEFHGQGYGKEAWGAALAHLKMCGIRQIEAGMMVANTTMMRICMVSGMTTSAFVPGHFLLNGTPHGLVIMSSP